MKRNGFRVRQLAERSIARREAEYAALRANSECRFDDRISDSIYDIENERAEVDIIVRGMSHDEN